MIMFGPALSLGIDDITPIKVSALQAVDQNLRRCNIGGNGDVVYVTKAQ